MKKLLELVSNTTIKIKILKIPIMYHYMICRKWKLNIHGNSNLHVYWTYSKKILIKYHYFISCKLKLNVHRNMKLGVYWT
jgi:hypothetical protein